MLHLFHLKKDFNLHTAFCLILMYTSSELKKKKGFMSNFNSLFKVASELFPQFFETEVIIYAFLFYKPTANIKWSFLERTKL